MPDDERDPAWISARRWSTHQAEPRIAELTRALEGLEAQWQRLGAPICDALRPGLDEEGIASVEEQLGLEVPAELRGLWMWHDGTDLSPTACDVGPMGMLFLPSSEAADFRSQNMTIHPPNPPDVDDEPDLYWHPTWIPFMVQGPQRLYVDAHRYAASGASPVREVSWEWEAFDVDLSTSLADLVGIWTWLLAQDYYRWDAERGFWDCRFADIPVPLRRWG